MKYTTLPKFGNIVCLAHPSPPKGRSYVVTNAGWVAVDAGGVKAGVVEKSGAWFSHDSQRVGQGRENAKQFLREHPDIAAAIEAKVRAQSGVVAEAMTAGMDDGEEAAAAE